MSFSVGNQRKKSVFWLPFNVIIIQTAPRGRTSMAVVRAAFCIDLKRSVETCSKLDKWFNQQADRWEVERPGKGDSKMNCYDFGGRRST